ncbi:MAG TPA: sugar phosphate isomerase/epimerase family protein [Gemmataceae bacterium]|jgi:sugar phosphate isomerase/epimerase|nr:sugar phosphate isomerase/epimerase family protein [Gemmataceae bacterium]
MIRSSVTVSLTPEVRGGPFVFWDDLPAACRKARDLGFDAIEIFPPSPDALNAANVRKLLDEHGLALAAVGTGAGWVKHHLHLCLPEAEKRAQARSFIRSIIDAAGSLGAPAIIGSMQGRWGEGLEQASAFGHLADALNDLGEHSSKYGVPLLFEPLNRYETNMVVTVEAGLALLNRLVTKNIRLLTDLFHMNIEEADLTAALHLAGSRIGHIHFVDSNRRPAGLGHIDYQPIAKALNDIGYAGYLSAEALAYPDSDAAARQTIATFRKYFRSV